MKAYFVAICLSAFALSAAAQQVEKQAPSPQSVSVKKSNLTPEERAVRQLRKMSGPAMLKKEQMEPVKAVLLAREQEKERIKNEAIPNKKALKELNEKSEAQLKSILSEEQWKSWEKWREEQKAKRKDTPTNDEQD
ncbi:MAG: hypothetical protein ACK5CY_01180 [Bacteroidia bacterium]|jgi:hypothetical protein